MFRQKIVHKMFVLLRIISDAILIPLIIILAYSLKFKVGWIFQNILLIPYGNIYNHAQVEPYIHVMGIIIGLWMATFYLVNLYSPPVGLFPEVDEVGKVMKGVTIASLQVVAVSFFYKEIPESRAVLLYCRLNYFLSGAAI
jgi:hypothetical protein